VTPKPDRTCHGADETVAYFEEALASVPDWRMEVRGIVAGHGGTAQTPIRLTS